MITQGHRLPKIDIVWLVANRNIGALLIQRIMTTMEYILLITIYEIFVIWVGYKSGSFANEWFVYWVLLHVGAPFMFIYALIYYTFVRPWDDEPRQKTVAGSIRNMTVDQLLDLSTDVKRELDRRVKK